MTQKNGRKKRRKQMNEKIYDEKDAIGRCARTNTLVYPSEVEGYTAYCPELDEDLYTIEFYTWEELKQKGGNK